MQFSSRAQLNIALVLLAIVAIIALTGLILLFTRPGATQAGIGDVYGSPRGIAETLPLPPYDPSRPYEFPAAPVTRTIGTRSPIMVFFRGEYSNIYDMSKCWNDLAFEMADPQSAFSCFAVPTTGVAYEVTGFFWPTSSALPRPLFDIGGDIYCYENSPYDRLQLLDRLKAILVPKGWIVGYVNNVEVVECKKGATFIFPQGIGWR